MVVPALIYPALERRATPALAAGASRWRPTSPSPSASCVLLGWRVPRNLIIFLTALAIADDLGAVLVIAIFYTASIDKAALGAAAGLAAVLVILNRGGVRNLLPYGIVGVLLWYAMLRSGIHATVAGIVLALSIPTRPTFTPAQFEARIDELHRAFAADRRDLSTPTTRCATSSWTRSRRRMEHSAQAVQSPLQRLEHELTPWITFAVVPVFALANAGIDLGAVQWSKALPSGLSWASSSAWCSASSSGSPPSAGWR